MAAKDTKWLLKRGGTWSVVKAVPRPLWDKVEPGKTVRQLVKALHTDSHALALSRRHSVLAEFERIINAARDQKTQDRYMAEALGWREGAADGWRGIISAETARHIVPRGDAVHAARFVAETVISEIADDIAEGFLGEGMRADSTPPYPAKEAAARRFYRIAIGAMTPIDMRLDAWLREGGKRGPLRPITARNYRADAVAVFAWLKQRGVETCEELTAKLVGEYADDRLQAGELRQTINRRLTAPSAYWRWLQKRGHVSRERNPWTGQRLSVPKHKTKRAFTDNEMRELLAGDCSSSLSDAMHMLALTGMRAGELSKLTAKDVVGGWFNVAEDGGKTDAATRRVPIHSDLEPIVARLTAGRKPSDNLLGLKKPERQPGQTISTWFVRYRQKAGVGPADGRSPVDLHSFRRWFVSAARNAGIDRAVVAAVVGHEAGNITDDVYSGVGDAAKSACVEAVRLPA